jgi:hypothetical protein
MTWKTFWSPALKIAGGRALVWGLGGLAVSVAAATVSGTHANGILNYGPGENNVWWLFALEYAMIWLIPSAVFYCLGSALSPSRIRAIDVAGTTAFALLPIAVTTLVQLLPGIREIIASLAEPVVDVARLMEVATRPLFWLYTVVLMAMFALMLVWLFNAVRVSCNLRGGRLWATFLGGLVGGDIICKLILRLLA